MTRETIISIDSTTMVNLGTDGKPAAHGKKEIEFVKNRLQYTLNEKSDLKPPWPFEYLYDLQKYGHDKKRQLHYS